VGRGRDRDGSTRRVELLDLNSGDIVLRLAFEGGSNGCCVADAQFDRSGDNIVIAEYEPDFGNAVEFVFVDTRTGHETGRQTLDVQLLSGIRYDVSPDGTSVALITPDGVELRDRDAGLVNRWPSAPGDLVTAVAYLPGDQIVIAWAGPRPRLAIFDAGSGRLRNEQPISATIHSLEVGPTDDVLVGGGQDGAVERWQLPALQPLPGWRLDVGTVVELAVADDGSVLAAGLDGTVELVNATGGSVGVPLSLGTRVFPVSFAGDPGEAILTTSHGVRLLILDPDRWLERACAVAGRELTPAEWAAHVGDEAPHPTCSTDS
jgi:WD40 repeat protein